MSGQNPYSPPQEPVCVLPEAGPPRRSALAAHPLGFWFFFWGEFAERCCYYGMLAILLRYMIESLGFSDANGQVVMSYFMAACYFLPLVGGYVADHYFGKYCTIVFFSLPYIIGQLLLRIESVPFLVIALSLLAMGSGVIKPNISTLMGLTYDQQRPGEGKLRSDAFAIFYGAINIGSAISSFAMPWLRDNWGYQNAFLFPAGLMAIAFLIFAAGKPFYAKETIRRVSLSPEDRRQRLLLLRRILGLFVVVAFFWTIFNQAATTWILFARDHLVLNLFGMKLAPDQLGWLNAVLIILLLPPITMLWHLLARLGWNLRPTDKMLIGFVLTALTMAVMSAAGYVAGERGLVSVYWEVVSYLLITVAEICISVVGLELAFAAAPSSMKSFVTACWLLAGSFGSIMTAWITPYYGSIEKAEAATHFTLSPGLYFGALALLMVPVTIAFVLVAQRFNQTAGRKEPA
jgi:POT family proton-dependent oligopeptide transporter